MGVGGPNDTPDSIEPAKEVTKEVLVATDRPASDASPELDSKPSRAHFGWKLAVALALMLGGLMGLLFPLVTGWLFGLGIGTMYGGEVLSRTNGLDPSVFEVSYWLSLWLNIAIVLWSVVRRFTGKVHPWRPLFWGTLV